jgi:hypothetical protein
MGAEVQRPLATVVIGGVVGAMVMSLLVLRVLYFVFQEVSSMQRIAKRVTMLALPVFLAGLAGCGAREPSGTDKSKPSPTQVAEAKGGNHSGWWCDEHGIPEAECSMCSAKVAAAFKKKGDWCDKHDRALSQCFVCNPKQREFYAAKYRAKYGKEPPPTEDEEKKDDKGKKDDKS